MELEDAPGVRPAPPVKAKDKSRPAANEGTGW
jgi:hypothetical protein